MLNIHDILINEVKKLPEGNIAVLLSAGIDSASVLFSLLECGRQVKAYSFRLENRYSRDFLYAEKLAKSLGIEFEQIILPTDVEAIKKDVIYMATIGCRKKTDFECVFPMLYSYKQIKEPIIASGIPADGYFCLSKSGMMHYKNNLDKFRANYFSKPNAGQKLIREKLAKKYNKILFDPYYSRDLYVFFKGKTWDELNRPKQKMPILNSFPEQFKRMKIFPHTNFHKGDSGISDNFKQLLKTDLNTKNYKSVTGVYNEAVRLYAGQHNQKK